MAITPTGLTPKGPNPAQNLLGMEKRQADYRGGEVAFVPNITSGRLPYVCATCDRTHSSPVPPSGCSACGGLFVPITGCGPCYGGAQGRPTVPNTRDPIGRPIQPSPNVVNFI